MHHRRPAPRRVGWDLIALAVVMLVGLGLMAGGLASAQGNLLLAGFIVTLAGVVPGAVRVAGIGRR